MNQNEPKFTHLFTIREKMTFLEKNRSSRSSRKSEPLMIEHAFEPFGLKHFLESSFNPDYDPEVFTRHEIMLFLQKNTPKRPRVTPSRWSLYANELKQLFEPETIIPVDINNTTALLTFIF